MNILIMCFSIVYAYIYIQIHACIHGVLHQPHMHPREDTLNGEHVYAPGRTPSSASTRHTWARERTLTRPQAVLHVNPSEDTLN